MPKTTGEDFFETRQDWSRRKHLILSHYLKPAVAKLRRASPDGRVIIIDGFAGWGKYEDGSPGSPILMGQLADTVRSWDTPIDLQIHNVEADSEGFSELENSTQDWVARRIVTNHRGTFVENLPAIMAEAKNSPVVAFLDPLRPTQLTIGDFAPLLGRYPTTELLIVFHTPLVFRMIKQVAPSALTSDAVRIGSMRTLDEVFGGERWRRFLNEDPCVEEVVDCFVEEVAARFRVPGKDLYVCKTPIEARHTVNLKYHVVFATRHFDGVILINDAFAKEKAETFTQAIEGREPTMLFEEFADPLEEEFKQERVDRLVVTALQSDPEHIWTYDQLFMATFQEQFGRYSQTNFNRTVRRLLSGGSRPQLIGVSGNRLKKGGWKVDREIRVRWAAS